MRARCGLTISFLVITTASPCALVACEDETNNTSSPGTPVNVPTIPTSEAGALDAGVPDDSGGGADSGGEVVPDAPTIKIANFSNTLINACIRGGGSDPFVGPLFRAAGIPPNGVSARVLVPNPGGNKEVKIIAVGESCEAAGLATTTINYGAAPKLHAGHWYRGGTGQTGGGWIENVTPTVGKETVRAMSGSERDPSFVRDDDAGPPVDLTPPGGGNVLLDPDLVGKILAVGEGVLERPIKTKAGGTLSLWSRSAAILLCDESAPAVDGLTDCSPTLRSP